MGMGKTIQTIALLLTRRGPAGEPTMVVCPTVAMLQVRSAISVMIAVPVPLYHTHVASCVFYSVLPLLCPLWAPVLLASLSE